jgi:hypothetical protein
VSSRRASASNSSLKSPARIDVAGAALLAAGLVSLRVALTEGEHWGWSSLSFLTLIAGSAILLAAWAATEIRVAEPMVDMRMMSQRPVLLTNPTALIAGFAMFGSFVLVPLVRKHARGIRLRLRGVADGRPPVSRSFVGHDACSRARSQGCSADGTARKWPLALGMALVAVAGVGLASLHHEPVDVIAAMVLLGAGVAASFVAMAALITENVRPTETGVATGMSTVMRTVGGVVGGQIGAAILTSYAIAQTGQPEEQAYTIAFDLSAAAAAVASCVAVFTAPLRTRRQPKAAEALD